jgi:prevent-host-death family protein
MPRHGAEVVRARAGGPANWKLEDAKARFSELVRRAHDEGPQAVTVRGRRAVVIVVAEEYDRLATPAPEIPLVAFLESLHMDGLELTRDRDEGREVEL